MDRLWAGIDTGDRSASLCVTDDRGSIVLEQTLDADADTVMAALEHFPSNAMQAVGIEAGAGGNLARKLKAAGLPIVVLEARKASKILSLRRNKTDRNDARGLADIVRLGSSAVPEVHEKSLENRLLRQQLTLRQQLIKQRVAGEHALRAAFREHGIKLKSAYTASALRPCVESALMELRQQEIDLNDEVLPLLALCEGIRQYTEATDKRLLAAARSNPVCKRFLAVPGIGPICALSFYSAIDDPDRFTRTEDVASFLGLTPRVRVSGRQVGRPRISKMGNAMTRSHLTMSAEVLLCLCKQPSHLRSQALALRERVGFARARIAVARKLAILLLALWKSGEAFDPLPYSSVPSLDQKGGAPHVNCSTPTV